MAEEKEKETGKEISEFTQVIAGILKVAPIETRKELGRIIRTDPNIWNSVNGVGNIEEALPKGKMQGIIKSGGTLLNEVTIAAMQEGVEVANVKTDSTGFYSIELEGGSYDFIITKQDYNTEVNNSEPIFPGVEMTKNVELISAV